MDRRYKKWYSPALQKEMELLVFGSGGASVLFFPARLGRFYDYENWKIIEAIRPKIEAGHLQLFCVDSVDSESFYNRSIHPADRINRHRQYEQYIVNEVLPFMQDTNPNAYQIAAGCSLGAYHAVNIALRNAGKFQKVIGMSGRYDLTQMIAFYDDLFGGFWNEDIYFNMPSQYLPNLGDDTALATLRQMQIVLAVGRDDVLLESNRYLEQKLQEKQMHCSLHVWDYEAHRAKFWRQMVAVYF